MPSITMTTEDSAAALVVLYALGALGGYGISWIKSHIRLRNPRHQLILENIEVPPLVGMLLFGLFAGLTLPSVVHSFDHQWSLYVRTGAQVLVLLRCGLSLRLGEISYEAASFALWPQLLEAVMDTLLAYWVLDLPFPLAIATGVLVSSIAPALVIPLCMRLQAHGYGQSKQIQELVMGATACDHLFALVSNSHTAFALLASLALCPLAGQSELMAAGIVACGVPLGLIVGLGLSLIRCLHWVVYLLCLLTMSLGAILLSQMYFTPGLGYLAVLVAAGVSGRSRAPYEQKLAAMVLLTAWKVLEVILFSLAGAALVDQTYFAWIWQSAALAVLGIAAKATAAFLLNNDKRLTGKERIYCALSRLPKATMQAALAGVFLAAGLSASHPGYTEWGHRIMALATLSILFAAPISNLLSAIAPRLLPSDLPLLYSSTSLKPMHIPTPLMRMRQAFSQQKQFLSS